MAEATDRPQGAGPTPSIPEQRFTTLDAGATTAAQPYRPLSLLALLSFALAAAYAVLVLIGAAVALFNRFAWLLPGWTFVLPLAILALCWVARTRIRDSEGTLTGLAFTTWGFRLTVLIALTYGAYYAATFFAVRGQASEKADSFFEQLKQGNIEQAYLLAAGESPKETDRAELRNTIELRFNAPKALPGGGGQPGDFTRFSQNQYVRLITMDGPQTHVDLRGAYALEHNKDGYRVGLRYHVATSLADFELDVETVGRESKPGEPKGRQWRVVFPRDIAPEALKWTPHGRQVLTETFAPVQQFASAWTEKVNQRRWVEAYLDTLPPSERSRLQKGQSELRFLAAAPMSGLAALGLLDENFRDLLAMGMNWESGKLLHLDEKTFWAGKQQRADILQRVRNTFRAGAGAPAPFNVNLQNALPLLRQSEGRTQVVFDVGLLYFDETIGAPQYTLQGQLIVNIGDSGTSSASSAWYIDAINLESGRTPPEPPNRGGRRGP